MDPSSSGTCVECDKAFPSDELVYIHQSCVCAQCKPLFMQRLLEGVAPPGCAFWRVGNKLVARLDSRFPDRCVKCNAPANGFQLKRAFIFPFGARKRPIIHIGLCHKHRVRYKLGVILGWCNLLLGLTLLLGGVLMSHSQMAAIGQAVLIGGGIIAGILMTTVSPTKITHDNMWIAGVHRDFLDQLPEWPGPV